MPRPRASWLVLLAVIIVTAAVPSLRAQLALGLLVLAPSMDTERHLDRALWSLRAVYSQRAVAFVEQHYPKDPEMLMAAGLLTENADVLKRAAEMGRDAAAWAAYAGGMLSEHLKWDRIGTSGVDPQDAVAVAAEQRRISESGLPTTLAEKDAQPALSAVRAWQEADPDNALPLALKSMYLYAMHRDADALAAWTQAGRLPRATFYGMEQARAQQRLLVALGMPSAEAAAAADQYVSYAWLRNCARIAMSEGRLAQMSGRPQDAIAWWQSTVNLGARMNENGDTMIASINGAALVGISAGPVWRWVPDRVSGIPNGPLFNGRLYWGDQRNFYLRQMGPAADAELRDTLLRAKVRSNLMREALTSRQASEDFRFVLYLGLAAAAFALTAVLFILFLLVGVWRRRVADEATRLRPIWQFLLTFLIITPIAVGSILYLRHDLFWESGAEQRAINLEAIACFVSFCLLLLVLPATAALRSRPPGARFRTAWRGNLRRILPLSIALSALLFLSLMVASVRESARFVDKFTNPQKSEMAQMVAALGDKWHNPPIPPDSWRAQYPPKRPADTP